MYQAEKYHGVTVDSVLKEYNVEYNRMTPCKVKLSDQESDGEFAMITPGNCKPPYL